MFAKSVGMADCLSQNGEVIHLPVIQGIFKHLTPEKLKEVLQDPSIARKYTVEALKKMPWSLLRQFPRGWLLECLDGAHLSHARKTALIYLLT